MVGLIQLTSPKNILSKPHKIAPCLTHAFDGGRIAATIFAA
jgi:hypothetical protein